MEFSSQFGSQGSHSLGPSSQGSFAKHDLVDQLNVYLESIGLEGFSVPLSSWKQYTARTKQKYFRGMQVQSCHGGTFILMSVRFLASRDEVRGANVIALVSAII